VKTSGDSDYYGCTGQPTGHSRPSETCRATRLAPRTRQLNLSVENVTEAISHVCANHDPDGCALCQKDET
jgi:hypothetical protein